MFHSFDIRMTSGGLSAGEKPIYEIMMDGKPVSGVFDCKVEMSVDGLPAVHLSLFADITNVSIKKGKVVLGPALPRVVAPGVEEVTDLSSDTRVTRPVKE